ncbi:MAG: hypothetical protein P4L69_20370 [Desulfosporosinus sp.]|nr:hypothetical protein [Desulfosporosinus sp.]
MLLTMAFLLVMPVVVFADNSTSSTSNGGTDILSTVTNASSAGSAVDTLQASAQTAGNSFIKFLRTKNTMVPMAECHVRGIINLREKVDTVSEAGEQGRGFAVILPPLTAISPMPSSTESSV